MKSNEWLRKQIKNYLAHPRSMLQNELARKVNIPTSTFSDFLNGKDIKIDHDLYRRIVDIVAPWEYDIHVTNGRLKCQLLRKRYTEDQINAIGIELAKLAPNFSTKDIPNATER